MDTNNKEISQYTPLTTNIVEAFMRDKKDAINSINEKLKKQDEEEAERTRLRKEQEMLERIRREAIAEQRRMMADENLRNELRQTENTDEKISKLTEQVSKLTELMTAYVSAQQTPGSHE